METIEISIPAGAVTLQGNLSVPPGADSLVIFSHGSGSSRFSTRNAYVAETLNRQGIATLLTDLLTPQEDTIYENRFDIGLITERLAAITDHVRALPEPHGLPVGYFGASTGAASALRAAALLGDTIFAVVSRGGRPDLAGTEALEKVTAPVLLLVGSLDTPVIPLNEQAYAQLRGPKSLQIVEGATHLFEEPGKLHEAAALAADWFAKHRRRNPKLSTAEKQPG